MAATTKYAKGITIDGEDVLFKPSTAEGYLNSEDGKFYSDTEYTSEIAAEAGAIYVALDENVLYRYDAGTTQFVPVGSAGSGGVSEEYVNNAIDNAIGDAIAASY